jgi:hypothetical protein
MTVHPWLRGRPALAVLASVAAVAVAAAGFALAGGSRDGRFPRSSRRRRRPGGRT